jgi:hypothetical protein
MTIIPQQPPEPPTIPARKLEPGMHVVLAEGALPVEITRAFVDDALMRLTWTALNGNGCGCCQRALSEPVILATWSAQ